MAGRTSAPQELRPNVRPAAGDPARIIERGALDSERAKGRRRSRSSQVGLDWFAFFCANLQTGFGPFINGYLTASHWTQTDIGLVTSVSGVIGLIGQIPGGAYIDATPRKIAAAGFAVVLIGVAALAVAGSAFFPVILFAWVLHAAASCVLSPSFAIISLGLVGHAALGPRLGRNATFASVGSALAAGAMGWCGDYLSNRAVFIVTAALAIPSLVALRQIRLQVDPAPVPGNREREDRVGSAAAPVAAPDARVFEMFRDRRLLVLCAAMALFYLSNAAMLPLVGSMLTMRAAHLPNMLIAACIIVPQIMVAVLAPGVGRLADGWGRKPLLLVAFAALPVRGVCFGLVTDPVLLVAVQLLDGVSGAVLGIVVALVAADLTRANGRFALAQGVVGTAMGLGASLSPLVAGLVADHLGSREAFFVLSTFGAAAFVLALLALPETRTRAAL